ncbi:MAG: AAA family ATPase [Aquificae bacterium]|nr:AAA family ATPase [Aquificota bacterium]
MEHPFLKKLLSSGRVPHALLFYGREGSGKTYAAFKLAGRLLCKDGPCRPVEELREALEKGELEPFTVYEEKEGRKSFLYLMGEHPDLAVVVPSGSYVKIDQIRGIKEFVSRRPVTGRKVVIIDDAHAMTRQAANALLKTLEEPPPDTHFILTAPSKSALLPTIVSRTFPVEFKGFTDEEVARLAGVEPELAKLARGSVKRAKLLKEKRTLLEAVKTFLNAPKARLYTLAQEFEKLETEDKRLFLELLEALLEEQAKKGSEKAARALETVSLFKEGLARGVNAPLWLFKLKEVLS